MKKKKAVTRGRVVTISKRYFWGSTDPNQKGPPDMTWAWEMLGWTKKNERKHR
jgi:hypothetical protein